ncbi:MAG: hypothetical protein AAFN77_03435 [Planctomycetota bacterium]
MTNQKHHIVILPYFCQEEVDRYLLIADRLATFPTPSCRVTYLLASSPKTETSQPLVDRYSELGDTIPFACPTQIFGYPEGPGAMFWDCMAFIEQNFADNDGLSLWLESDMAPVKPDWIDRLSTEWFAGEQTPVMMGCYVPEVYKYRIWKKPKLILHPHINGGACYSMDFSSQMPPAAREGVFDMAVFQFAEKLGRARFTKQIAFSTNARVRRDLLDENKVLLHGFMQDKDKFITNCLEPLTDAEKDRAGWNPFYDRLETFQRHLKVQFVRRGRQAMLENMFLEKQKYEDEHPEQFLYQPRVA